jgi:hypothetical protein
MLTLEQVLPQTETVDEVDLSAIERLRTHSADVTTKAMELTDAWGQAMFILDRRLVKDLFSTLGFSEEVSSRVYDAVRSLSYVQHRVQGGGSRPEVTWHAMDATCMTLRGALGLGSAMGSIDDSNVEAFLEENADLFEKLMEWMPDYARHLMFSPEVAATVVATLGGNLRAGKIYELAATYGRQVTRDLDGRRGVSTQFIRSLTLTIAARAQLN